MGASKEIKALVEASSLPVLDLFAGPWVLASSSSFLAGLAKILMQGLRQARNPGAMAMELKNKECDTVFSNELADPLGIKLLEL